MGFAFAPDRSCLLLDVDGSLIDIAPRPEAVVVPASLVRDLDRASRAVGGALALVSGRSIAQLDGLFQPLRLRASGVHGAEMRFDPHGPTVRSEEAAVPAPVQQAVTALLQAFPGAFVEDKSFSLAIHYRAVPAAGPALLAALTRFVDSEAAGGLHLLPGHFVIELKRPSFDKGKAVRQFLGQPPFRGRVPVFVGDDITDRPGFAAALTAGGAAYGVGQDIPGTTGTFDSPSAVRAWVGAIADQETMPA